MGTGKLFSTKLNVQIDFGQHDKLFSSKDTQIKDADGKLTVFNSMVDAMNFFGALTLSLNSLGQEIVSAQGDFYTNASGSIDFTIGEVVINTGTDGTNYLPQVFHQMNWNFLGVEDFAPNAIIFNTIHH